MAAIRALSFAALAELYRSLGRFRTLPTANELSVRLQASGFSEATEQMVSAVYKDIDALSEQPPTPETEKMVTECVRRLRQSDDGGESDLDRTCEPGVRIVPLTGWQGHGVPEWIIPSEVREPTARILFLHGGAYEFYSPSDVYRPLTTRLAAATQLPVFAVDYRLAPAHIFPAAVEDALYALSFVWEHGPPEPSNSATAHEEIGGSVTSRVERASAVYMCGDSSGGGLGLAVVAALGLGQVAPGRPLPDTPWASFGTPSREFSRENAAAASETARRALLPTALALISPWNDLTSSGGSYYSRAWNGNDLTGDPIFSNGQPEAEAAKWVENARRYAGEVPLTDPRLSPLFMPPHVLGRWLPPTLMVVGDAEVMLDEATELAARVLEARSTYSPETTESAAQATTSLPPSSFMRVRVYRRMWHVWPMYSEACGQAPAATVASGAMGCSQEGGGGLHHAWMALRDLDEWIRTHPAPSCRDSGEQGRG